MFTKVNSWYCRSLNNGCLDAYFQHALLGSVYPYYFCTSEATINFFFILQLEQSTFLQDNLRCQPLLFLGIFVFRFSWNSNKLQFKNVKIRRPKRFVKIFSDQKIPFSTKRKKTVKVLPIENYTSIWRNFLAKFVKNFFTILSLFQFVKFQMKWRIFLFFFSNIWKAQKLRKFKLCARCPKIL